MNSADPSATADGLDAPGGAAAFYVLPPLWVDAPPDNLDVSFGPGEDPPAPRLAQLEDTVRTATLPGKLRLRVHRDGMFVFDFAHWAPRPAQPPYLSFEEVTAVVLRRVTLMNAYLACLHTAMLESMRYSHEVTALTPKRIIPMNTFTDPTGMAMPDSAIDHLYQARFPGSYNPLHPMQLDDRLGRPSILDIDTLDDSFARLLEVLERTDAERILGLAELLVRSGSAFGDHDYSISLVLAWSIVEALIDELWERYVENALSSSDPPASDRRNRLQRWTAAAKAEALSLANLMPSPLYSDVDNARRARNRWMHELRPASPEQAQASITTAESLLKHAHGITFVVPKSRRIQI